MDEDLEIIYLDQESGQLDSLKYYFSSQSMYSQKQQNTTYFILPLEQTSDYNCQKSCQANEIENQLQKNKGGNCIGGFIHCNYKGQAEKFKSEILELIKNSIYFKIGEFEEGFSNVLSTFKTRLFSLDIIYDTSYSVSLNKESSRIQISLNLFMKIEQKIYLSKSIIPSLLNNIWGIKNKGSNKYREVDYKVDFSKETPNYYLLKENSVFDIQELILSDSQNSFELITSNVTEKYPILILDNILMNQKMHFFKIIDLF
ncbi:hypothetical protein TTHERM_00577050 (macronuclear) [Tetrahymena thermophila SB210]|uniref:Uncharacterized protein n=1 Tax=Tetrahymena thermophila (strain SB210) TaxID=312017 RepID=Q22UZ8_TETTS|nr:hypothetical protein TTHERM_00577050 [Tetrahymena thermophila SB210]EAR89150.2 hypothetical protein TTHERM_00577050 [Tetrahymena thermophila SB210]|eukprot:XP_001009395.2 hypothetical protein TTHERM_00577050 [Tetrahymena thermophila SB210]